MVTGVETAGLVLAVFPLVISALVNYHKGLERTANIWSRKQYELKIKRLILRLKSQRTQYHLSLTKLIHTAAPEVVFDKLPIEYTSDCWRGKVGKQVAEYLDSCGVLESFKETVELYEDYLKEVASKMQSILRPAKADPNDLRALLDVNKHRGGKYSFIQRVQFIMKEDDVDELIRNLNESNLSLRDFIDDSESLHQLEAKHSSARRGRDMAKALYRIRGHADTLYRVIGLKCNNHCHLSHETVLFLENRCLSQRKMMKSHEATLHFRILFSASTTSPQYGWHETRVAVEEGSIPPLREEDRSMRPTQPPKRRVGFSDPKESTERSNGLIEVQDLCKVIYTAQKAHSSSCLRLFENGILFWHRPEPIYQPTVSTQDLISLEHWLEQRNRTEPEKLVQLALDISASLLQLNVTPWLEKTWTKKMIYFCKDSQGLQRIHMDKPVLLRDCKALGANDDLKDDPEAALLELGILLLELWDRRTLEMWAADSGNAMDDTQDGRMLIAIKWFRVIKDNLPPSYRDVVGRCIRPSVFDSFKMTWQDANFRTAVYDNIVEPLLLSCVA